MMSTQPTEGAFYQTHNDVRPTQLFTRPRVLHVRSTLGETEDKYLGVIRWLRRISCFLAFHILNCILGIIAFALVVVGLALSLVLFPFDFVCGASVFQSLRVITETLAQLDVRIANLIIEESSEKITRIALGAHVSDWNTATKALPVAQPGNSSKSLSTLLLYFATVKPAVVALSFLVLAFIVSFLTSAIPEESESTPDIAIVFFLSNLLLVVLAMLSRELTECYCATINSNVQRRAGYDEGRGNGSLAHLDESAVI